MYYSESNSNGRGSNPLHFKRKNEQTACKRGNYGGDFNILHRRAHRRGANAYLRVIDWNNPEEVEGSDW